MTEKFSLDRKCFPLKERERKWVAERAFTLELFFSRMRALKTENVLAQFGLNTFRARKASENRTLRSFPTRLFFSIGSWREIRQRVKREENVISSISVGTVAQSQRVPSCYKSFGRKLISVLMLNRFSFVFAVKVETSVLKRRYRDLFTLFMLKIVRYIFDNESTFYNSR